MMYNPFDEVEVLEDLSDYPFSAERELGVETPGERRWLLWLSQVEALLGVDSLDGDQENNGYSLDFASDAFDRGETPEEYVQLGRVH